MEWLMHGVLAEIQSEPIPKILPVAMVGRTIAGPEVRAGIAARGTAGSGRA
jgi:hypothetical protein